MLPQGEFEEVRALMARMDGENKLMRHVLARGRSLVEDLQRSMPDQAPADSPQLQEAAAKLGTFIGEARALLDQQAAVYRRIEELPNWRKGLTG